MRVLTTSNLSQNILVIPREYDTGVVIELRDESTDNVVLSYPTASTSGDYLSIDNIYSLVENRYYTINIYGFQAYRDYKARVILDGGTFVDNPCCVEYYYTNNTKDVIYKDKIFCTNQEVDQLDNEYYSVNDGAYTQHTSNNDYIIL